MAAGKAGAAALTVARNALQEGQSTREQLRQIAKDSPSMGVAAENYARRIAVKQAVLLKLFQPLARLVGVSREYFDNQFASDLAEKVTDIPEENLTTPLPSVAVPAMQGLSYSLEEPDLKAMYLSLLATASDDRVSDSAHPSFADIIKQLSAREAALLGVCLRSRDTPMVRVKLLANKDDLSAGFTILQNHLIDLKFSESGERVEEPSGAVWIDNWVRLGLMNARYDERILGDSVYDWVDGRPEIVRMRAEYERETAAVDRDNGLLRPTDFGLRFADAVAIGK